MLSKENVVLNGLFLSVVFLIAYYFLAANMAVLELDVVTDKKTLFRIYYKDIGSQWSQDKSSTVFIKPEQTRYSFRMADIKNLEQLRIDTSENSAVVTVRSLVLKQSGFKPVEINSEEQFAKLEVANGIAKFSYTDKGFTVIPATIDPFLIYTPPSLERSFLVGEEICRLALIIALAFLLAIYAQKISKRYRFVLCCGLVVITLIGVMAGVSRYNAHPDELAHVKAAEYFMDHTLPPQVGDPDTLNTYSIYGTSRLHVGEIAYLFAGKFARLLEPLQLQNYLAMRLFNVTLFGILCILALRSVHFRIILLPVMLSPQIWYLFSYFNSEAYSLFIALLVAYQMVRENSLWNRLLDGEKVRNSLLGIVGLGVLLALLLLAKKNFYVFSAFLGVYFLWRLGFKKTILNKTNMLCIAAVAVVGLSLFGAVKLTDSYINDFEKSKKKYEARETYGREMYKPSTPLDKKYVYLQIKDRGVTAKTLLEQSKWAEKSFRTAFGGYGYGSVAASINYYDTVRYTSLALLMTVIAFVMVRGGWDGRTLLVITLLSGAGLVVMSFYHSWTQDFQAQGRYFLPFVGMVSMFIYHLRYCLSNIVFGLLFGTMFGISMYSFIFVGLAGIAGIDMVLG